ncbi:hypothetical protein WA158_007331 [Blastocystis sp. Blastoise]
MDMISNSSSGRHDLPILDHNTSLNQCVEQNTNCTNLTMQESYDKNYETNDSLQQHPMSDSLSIESKVNEEYKKMMSPIQDTIDFTKSILDDYLRFSCVPAPGTFCNEEGSNGLNDKNIEFNVLNKRNLQNETLLSLFRFTSSENKISESVSEDNNYDNSEIMKQSILKNTDYNTNTINKKSNQKILTHLLSVSPSSRFYMDSNQTESEQSQDHSSNTMKMIESKLQNNISLKYTSNPISLYNHFSFGSSMNSQGNIIIPSKEISYTETHQFNDFSLKNSLSIYNIHELLLRNSSVSDDSIFSWLFDLLKSSYSSIHNDIDTKEVIKNQCMNIIQQIDMYIQNIIEQNQRDHIEIIIYVHFILNLLIQMDKKSINLPSTQSFDLYNFSVFLESILQYTSTSTTSTTSTTISYSLYPLSSSLFNDQDIYMKAFYSLLRRDVLNTIQFLTEANEDPQLISIISLLFDSPFVFASVIQQLSEYFQSNPLDISNSSRYIFYSLFIDRNQCISCLTGMNYIQALSFLLWYTPDVNITSFTSLINYYMDHSYNSSNNRGNEAILYPTPNPLFSNISNIDDSIHYYDSLWNILLIIGQLSCDKEQFLNMNIVFNWYIYTFLPLVYPLRSYSNDLWSSIYISNELIFQLNLRNDFIMPLYILSFIQDPKKRIECIDTQLSLYIGEYINIYKQDIVKLTNIFKNLNIELDIFYTHAASYYHYIHDYLSEIFMNILQQNFLKASQIIYQFSIPQYFSFFTQKEKIFYSNNLLSILNKIDSNKTELHFWNSMGLSGFIFYYYIHNTYNTLFDTYLSLSQVDYSIHTIPITSNNQDNILLLINYLNEFMNIYPTFIHFLEQQSYKQKYSSILQEISQMICFITLNILYSCTIHESYQQQTEILKNNIIELLPILSLSSSYNYHIHTLLGIPML